MTRPAVDYRSGRHCVFLLHAHLVFTPKYRRRIFTSAHLAHLNNTFTEVCHDFDARLVEFNGEADHVHLLVEYPPHVELSKLVNSLKGVSSRLLRRDYPDITRHFWNDSRLWSRSYFAASCGGAPIEVLRQYIEQQHTPE